jgi:hypothetical protein
VILTGMVHSPGGEYHRPLELLAFVRSVLEFVDVEFQEDFSDVAEGPFEMIFFV